MSFSKLQSKAKIKIMKESQEPEPEDEPGMSDQFLANDVMKVTSWLMSSKLETALSDLRYLSSIFQRGYSVKCWVGVCQRDTETLTLSAAHTHTLYMGVQPLGF